VVMAWRNVDITIRVVNFLEQSREDTLKIYFSRALHTQSS
jgi:hypothetical protein